MGHAQQARPRLDRDARRQAILDVAQEVFLEEGFAAASMSEIAARLGGSKGTLYNYFKSKDDLFEAYVQSRCQWQQIETYALNPDETVAEAMTRLGRTYLANVLSDQTLGNFRLITAEAERAPEIGKLFYEHGPLRGAERLAAMIADLAKGGHLDIPDPLTAAHHFLGLCQNRYFKARLCNYVPELSPQQIDEEVAKAVDTFLRAFARR